MSWINSTSSYFAVCEAALSSSNVMNNFKSIAGFFVPTGYGDVRYCISQSRWLQSVTSSIANNSRSYSAIDTVGRPPVTYRGVSSDAWRVMESVHLISSSFGGGVATGSVIEFGSGVGNLMYGLKITFPELQYTASDFSPVNSLNNQYIQNVASGATVPSGALNNITYSVPETMAGSGPYSPTLFISELALTENDSASIATYYNSFVKDAQYVFMRLNNSSSSDRGQLVSQLNNDFTQSAYYCSDYRYKSTDYIYMGYK